MKRSLKLILIALTTLVLLLAAAAAWLLTRRTPNTQAERVMVVNGVVDSPFAWTPPRWATNQLHPRTGSYLVQPHTPWWRLLIGMHCGEQTPLRITLGKYRTPDQLRQHLAAHLLTEATVVDTNTFYLFRPNTYEVYYTTSDSNLLARMQREWQRERKSLGLTEDTFTIRGVALTDEQLITLASIVEEETNNAAEKPRIAAVYLNRLRLGMPLQADPTVKYAVGDFALRRILNQHLTVSSPYNTYLHTGLPPHPICTPSATSVRAVVQAPDTRELYFCASPDMDGTHRFATTLAQHNRNAAAFHAELNRRKIR